ncbi:MAG TPA: winged helix-turn-helix domain-containing protein [Amaricoccus sp.]|uniref:ATP-binding protein n=1 Tax=Amaricoccus sp. TaxID=1872485 RepID=UPI002C8844E7|nr:winged helix-turn-helix domain-containing protein [Amaricoccus sp.]HMQ92641.1 winged helix-turn-helix domain-containing protein [Amaricoccus sp.]HMR52889.1 winged helix-turn-helix domain-containing protein [Amaricoccus sp.]HMR59245.1 winged helix-turn-helix domain-containing protein [Amaricoccus sp.]HMT97738.1 winged helix-turn-helix domain-containing protein [Amaricoccus sp.]
MEDSGNRTPDSTESGWSAISLGQSVVSFGPFEFSGARHRLLMNGTPVRLGSRAAAILSALVSRPGELVSKDALLASAWPSTHVEEGNLRVQIAALRRTLGDDSGLPKYIVNEPGRGYRFVASVLQVAPGPATEALAPSAPLRENLPAQNSNLLGREYDIVALAALLDQSRLVTVAGAGGIGKTTVALALAHQIKHQFQGAAFFVDLAAVSEAAFVPFAVASAARIAIDTQKPVESLASGLRSDAALLIFDNCEHLIDTAATVAEALLTSALGIRIIATSHEPLRAQGERVYRLMPFDLPKGCEDLSLEEAVRLPAIKLFAQQMMAADDTCILGDMDVPFIVDICRRLDGLPLAIEIAASRAGALGIAELSERLDDRFGLLTTGRRTAAPRHQTLRNVLDWSHDNLGARDRVVLRRLAVFGRQFSLDAATMVASDERLTPAAVTEGVSSLVRKSLLMPSLADGRSTFRLLDSTRIYASERLEAAGEVLRVRQLHVHYLCDVLRHAEADWQFTPVQAWVRTYSRHLDDIRTALSWSFGPKGDDEAGVVLTSLALPLASLLGLHDEFRERLVVARERAAALESPQLVAELRLHVAANTLGYNVGQPVDQALARAVELAELTGKDRHRVEPLVQLASAHIAQGQSARAAELGQRALDCARGSGDPLAVLSASRAMAQAAHYAGEHAEAMELARAVIRHPAVNIPYTYGFMHSDRHVTMRWVLVRALWMTGRGDEAVRVADEGIAIAEVSGAVGLAQILGMAVIPMYLWRGDHDAARALTDRLRDHSERFAFKYWEDWCAIFDDALAWLAEERAPSAVAGRLEMQTLSTIVGLAVPLPEISGTQDWSAPELIRLRGERLLTAGETAAGEADIAAAIDLARRQGALAWELRGTASLARYWRDGPRRAEGAERLAAVLERLTASDGDRDQAEARALLGRLR